MSEITHQLFPDIVIDTGSGVQQGNFWRYKARKGGGAYFDLPSAIPFDPTTLEQNINDSDSEVYGSVAANLKGLQFLSQGPEGLFPGTISPALQKSAPGVFGTPVDLMNMAAQGLVDLPINFFDWAFGGFEGDMPSERYLSADPRKVVGGSAQIARGMEQIGDVAREGIRATEEAGLNVAIPEWVPLVGEKRIGARTLLEAFAFDMTPDESTKARKYTSLIMQIIGAAPVEGVAIARLATQLAKTTKNPTAERVYDAISEMHQNNPIKAAAVETAMGSAVGGGMVTSIEALEKVYPDAPQWMKNTIMAGGGLLLPIGAMTVGSTLYDVALKTPIIRLPLKVFAGATESLTAKGAEKAAARAIQRMGGDWKNRAEILGVTDQFKLALKEGRSMDEATRIAFTTPQLARNEARVLEAKLNAAADGMTAAQVTAQRQLIEEMRRFANFQEGHLEKLSASGGLGSEAYARYSGRLMDRRDSIFNALNEAILKLDLGGKPDSGVNPSVIQADYEQGLTFHNFEYNVNRIRAFREGQLGSLDYEQTQALSQAYETTVTKTNEAMKDAIKDAEERVVKLRKSMPDEMEVGSQERADFNMWLRREFETAYTEIDSLEDVLWNSISGMNRPKTESYVAPDGTDMGPQVLIDGVPIGEHFAAKIAALKGGERENQSKWIWKLSGRSALIDQASKGGGPDAEKVARQNVIIKEQEWAKTLQL